MDIHLVTIHWDYLNSEIRVSLLLVFITVVITLILLLVLRFPKFQFWRGADVQMNIKLGKVGVIKIKPNYEVRQIAHKAWVELVTRKAGILVDQENDVISDVYDSWYELFKEIRRLIRDIPANKLNSPDTKMLVGVLIKTLNDGMRPHLTLWQAKYKRWYHKAVEDDKKIALTPQDIQKSYPKYNELVEDMLRVNKLMVDYATELKKLLG